MEFAPWEKLTTHLETLAYTLISLIVWLIRESNGSVMDRLPCYYDFSVAMIEHEHNLDVVIILIVVIHDNMLFGFFIQSETVTINAYRPQNESVHEATHTSLVIRKSSVS